MGKEKPVNKISPCEADGHRIINTRLCSFCKYELHPHSVLVKEAICSKIK